MSESEQRSRRPGAVLSHNPQFLRLSLGEAVAEMGAQMTLIAMPLLVLSLTGSAAKAGVVGVARTVAMAASVIPAGLIADRVDRRTLLLGCSAIRLAAIASIPVALQLGRPPFGMLVAVALIDASLSSVFYVAERSLLPALVGADELAEAVTVNEARAAAAVLAGPPAGGALFGISRAAPFIADACSAVVAFASLLTVRPPPRAPEKAADEGESPRGGGTLRETLEGFRWLFKQPFLRAGSLLYAAENVTIYGVTLLALLILHRHGASSAQIGLAYTIVGVGGLVSAAISGPLRGRMRPRTAILVEPWAYVVLLPLLIVVHSPLAVGLVVACMFLPMTLSTSIIVGSRLAITPHELLGRVQATGAFLALSLSWLGPLAAGLLVQYGGESAAVLSFAGWAAATAVAATASRDFRSPP